MIHDAVRGLKLLFVAVRWCVSGLELIYKRLAMKPHLKL
jgi:hypothetical protein